MNKPLPTPRRGTRVLGNRLVSELGYRVSWHFKHRLPQYFHEVMTIALADEAKAFKSDQYKVNMEIWHDRRGRRCNVCLAGAVMAFSLDGHPDLALDPSDWNGGSPTENKLCALDRIRNGAISSALECIHGDLRPRSVVGKRMRACFDEAKSKPKIFGRAQYREYPLMCRVTVPKYGPKNRLKWRKAMFRIRDLLKKYDL